MPTILGVGKVIQARIIIGETLEKLLNRKRLSHFNLLFHARKLAYCSTYVKGINPCPLSGVKQTWITPY